MVLVSVETVEKSMIGNATSNDKPVDNLEKPLLRVFGFVDGFNLYHALEKFEPSVLTPGTDPYRYQKYKWLCLTSLMKKFVRPKSETLVGVELFTAYPNWPNTEDKRRRHETFVSAQQYKGVHVTLGDFKPKLETCRADLGCKRTFYTNVEKQTDINIAVSMIKRAPEYDKAILLTADSDQVPTISLLREMYKNKTFAVMPPIGRGAKDLARVCHEYFRMTEQHLIDCQFPNPLPIEKNGKVSSHLVKPTAWP